MRQFKQFNLPFPGKSATVTDVITGIDQTVAFSLPGPQEAAAVVAYVNGKAASRTDMANGLQLCFSTDRSSFEENEPIPAMVEFRYLNNDPERVLGDSTTARGRRLLLKSKGPGGRQLQP